MKEIDVPMLVLAILRHFHVRFVGYHHLLRQLLVVGPIFIVGIRIHGFRFSFETNAGKTVKTRDSVL